MMYRKIIFLIVWLFVILGIESQPPDNDSEKKQIILEYLDQELHILNKVVSYYKKINEPSSSNNRKKKGKPSDSEAFALVHATFFTFWIAVTLRIYSEFNLCLIEKKHETKLLDFYFQEITFAFNEFKEEIKEYRKVEKKKKSKSVVIDVNSYESFKFEEAIDMTLDLSLDFVSSESTLMEKEPDKYENGIIRWKKIKKHNMEGKIYMTIFRSCFFIRRTFHKTCLKIQEKRLSHFYSYIPIQFSKAKPVEFYSNAKNWKNVINDVERIYTHWYNFHSMDEVEFIILTEVVDGVINSEKLHNIQDFFTEGTLGSEKAQLVKETLHDRSWILSTLEDTSKIILTLENITKIRDTVQKKTSKNENVEISTEERIGNVIALLKSIREVDKMALSLGSHFREH